MSNGGKHLPLLKAVAANKMFLRLTIVFILAIIFFSIPKVYLGDTFPICLYRILLGKKCIGCGTIRAVWSVLHFQFHEAFEYNKMILITFPLLTGCIISWIIKDKKHFKICANS